MHQVEVSSAERPARVLVAVFALLTCAAVGYASWLDYKATTAQAESVATQMVRAVAVQTARGLDFARVMMEHVAQEVGTGQVERLPPDRHAAVREELSVFVRAFGDHSALWVVDAGGRVVLSSFPLPGPVSAAEQEHFKAVRDGAGFHLAGLIPGKIRRHPIILLARRIETADGAFAGAVLAGLDADNFASAFASLGLEEGAVAGILHTETAQPLARAPILPDLHRMNAARSRLFRLLLPRAAAGTYTDASALDGVERLYAYRKLDGYPVVAAVGVARSAVLEAWSRRLVITALIAVVLATLVVVLGRRVIGATAATAQANDRLRHALSDRTLLLSEVHHRVKNNLQIIQSLLTMESLGAPEASRSGYEDSLKRIQAMSMVHELLYQSGDFGAIRCREYLERLCGLLVGERPEVMLTVDGDDAVLDIDRAVPFAMAVNEIVSNALKHGFAGRRGGSLAVRLRHRGGELTATIADNGSGLPAGFAPGKSTSLGTRLLLGLADQLGGRVEFESAGGTTVRLIFPLD